ncbi:23S rRNA (guanosine(2251)-2'-O)-methyltransferase RlmB [Schlesneria paludicola]|uniref:23S rRNA (guanosine(2251)-2'-O)-methyltransferase RlmB n=1 Tax=Schlesneria paludicola TaxID=360056 RepID=UPI00029A7962|nr:23S rRNA (guanosine(2251)-2'-O)-methyltransferase RlmB [Schlesneria paludicola]
MTASRRPLMANHNRCWIWGRNLVLETVRAAYWPVLEMLHSDRCEPQARDEVVSLAMQLGIPTHAVSDSQITKSCRSEEHQGLAARMPPFPYRRVDELIDGLPPNPVLVLLDRLHDPYNFGAIIRSADVLGIHGVIVGTREQAAVNSLAARSSVGAVNHVPIAETDDLITTVEMLQGRGFQIIGTSDHADELIFDPDYQRATVLVIGNEGRGIQPALEQRCTQFVKIPVLGQVNSLNAAVSAGILFYEVLRQRRDD